MVTPPWEEPLPSCLIGGFHSPNKQTKSALRTVPDSHPSHGSQNQLCGGSQETKSKCNILCPIL
ncbi:hypothetical protein RND71_042272 [Anisodus tanguticus]|uniref:Uncharacterized protein n=1 Tax=Anisodus tanguticus TaxID=243964 RepID=A0AAE1QQM4_9SOLA|nr:hypothetical protein RND71_042272 [Anisodus tanguticus]